ncbi:MAG: chemotaxis protein CheW [Gammaproteobacteria bacterium]|nr:chemotaxis protein CheW [Gammaproteobacteria bacterium]
MSADPEQAEVMAGQDFVAPADRFVVFRTGSQTLLSSLDSIDEITDMMSVSPVPGTQDWFLGLGTRKGNLLPISDFTAYLGVDEADGDIARRLLVVGQSGEYFGLSVDEVVGLVTKEDISPESTGAQDVRTEGSGLARLRPLLSGCGELRGEVTPMVDLTRLLEQQAFVSIEASA